MLISNYIVPQYLEAFKTFPDVSRVWIYQADRNLTDNETIKISNQLKQFARQWTAHNMQLNATGEVFYNRFIVLVVDETQAGASGCSIDKSVHFLKELESEYAVTLFDRMDIAVIQNEGLTTFPLQQLKKDKALLQEDTLVFNNSLSTLSAFKNEWLLPKSKSWLKNN
jgi:hypothetical protein